MRPASAIYRAEPIAAFLGISFVAHLLWENAQAPLYEGFTSFPQHFWICFKATWGDLLFMFVIYATLAVVHRNPLWVNDKATHTHPATWILTLLVGILLAVSFELWAVHIDHRFAYAEAMPIVPILRIGLTPVLQMMLLPLMTLLLTFRFSRPA